MTRALSVSTKRSFVVAVVALAVVTSSQRAQAQPGWMLSHQKVSFENEPILGQTALCLIEAERNPVGFATFTLTLGLD